MYPGNTDSELRPQKSAKIGATSRLLYDFTVVMPVNPVSWDNEKIPVVHVASCGAASIFVLVYLSVHSNLTLHEV